MRLTIKDKKNFNAEYAKLADLEDIEDKLGIDLVTLFKAIMNDGLVYIKFDDNLSKCFNGNNIFVICCKWNFKCYPCFTVPFGTFFTLKITEKPGLLRKRN